MIGPVNHRNAEFGKRESPGALADSILVVTPSHRCEAGLAIAAARAGEVGLLDLGLATPGTVRARALADLARHAGGRGEWGVRWDTLGRPERALSSLKNLGQQPWPWLVIGGLEGECSPAALREVFGSARSLARRVLIEIHDPEAAIAAAQPWDGLILKANEAGGRVSALSSLMLLQRLGRPDSCGPRGPDSRHGAFDCPFWIQGAWGPDAAAAAWLAGAAGVVLCEELWLARESPLSDDERCRMADLDGSETTCVGDRNTQVRLFVRGPRAAVAQIEQEVEQGAAWPGFLYDRWVSPAASDAPAPRALGQGIAHAARLARRHVTTGGILRAFRTAVAGHLAKLGDLAVGGDAPLARDLGIRYPVFQGPMTRVSDVPEFCAAVADNGAMPFLALALMRGPEARELLETTRKRLGEYPWGVGILGFVPPALRLEQVAAIEAVAPRCAIIAGGRPAQARALEDRGIATYLHVPSPGLLAEFLRDGARRFIFEGRECGGHAGPRSSLTLWQSAIDALLDADIEDPSAVHVLFAGGIHDALSAAMVRAVAVPLVERGMKTGLLMGTAYLFTHEAVQCGAIVPGYQQQALSCTDTVLLDSGGGHATRCARTPFAEEFAGRKRLLTRRGASPEEIRFDLEMLNVGRLRVASKGLARVAAAGSAGAAETDGAFATREGLLVRGADMLRGNLVEVGQEEQFREGLYMIGDVATLRRRTLSIAELHEEVCAGGGETAARLAGLSLARRPASVPQPGEPIAIVGMACRFPGAPDLRGYCRNLFTGFDAVREVPAERWSTELYYSPDRVAEDRLYSKRGAFLDEYRFDPVRHGIPPTSLASIEPIQLLALDVAQAALEDAGYAEGREFPRNRTAVIFASGSVADVGIAYAVRTMLPQYLEQVGGLDETVKRHIMEGVRAATPKWTEDSFPGFLISVLSGRVANRLDLGGPNFTVDAACAASLAALSVAAEQLRSGRCDMALVGGADGTNHVLTYMGFAKTHALTPSGTARPFDDRADGVVLGEGVAAIVLKRLADAERDGDRVWAVIRGIGSSSDGRNRSLTAPHPEAQTLAIQRAYTDAGVDPGTVSLIEAHATGTAVGDRSEVLASGRVFEREGRGPYCAIGSVKSMIGHTKSVAGLAGLIKTVLALTHRVLPPTLNVQTPNRQAGFERGPFYVNTETRPWFASEDAPRRAGVSAFGFGGTNFHVVVEEYRGGYRDGAAVDLTPRPVEPFLWHRPDTAALSADIGRFSADIADAGESNLDRLAAGFYADECERLAAHGGVRLAVVAESVADLRAKLDSVLIALKQEQPMADRSGVWFSGAPAVTPSEVCFLFPGQGSQHVNMLRDLAQGTLLGDGLAESTDRLLAGLLPRPLTSYIWPRPVFDSSAARLLQAELDDTRIAQPALGLVDLMASDLLGRFGLRPAALAGHSYGEYVALSVAGLMSREDMLRLSALRGRAVYEAGREHPGGMAAIAASEEETVAALRALSICATIANLNGPRQIVIAGSVEAIDAVVKRFPERGLAVRRLAVTAAFHSPAVEAPSRAVATLLETIELRPPCTPVYSNVTGEPYPADLDSIRELLSIHLARPVRFADQVRAMHRNGLRVFIEAGPGRVLTGLVRRILEGRPHNALSLEAAGGSGWMGLAQLLAQAFALGLPVDLAPWFAGRGLGRTPVAAYLEQERQHREGRPTDWILSPRGSRPASAPRANPAASTIEPAADAVRQTRTRLPIPSDADPAPPDPLLAQLQDGMNKWLDLQRDQQRLTERFLDLHERIVSGLMGGAAPPAMCAPPAADPGAECGLPVAPAPVLSAWRRVPALPPPDAEIAQPPAVAEPAARAEAPALGGGLPFEARDGMSLAAFKTSLLAEVSRRTGYPEDMLDLNVALEAGLGIDSIKTMEIFGALKKYHKVLAAEDQDEEEAMVQLIRMKTLRDILDHYVRRRAEIDAAASQPRPGARGPAEQSRAERCPPTACEAVERLVLRPVRAPFLDTHRSSDAPSFPRNRVLLILGEARALGSALETALTTRGYRVVQLVPGPGLRAVTPVRFEVDLTDPERLRQFAAQLRESTGARVGGLVNLLTLNERMRVAGLDGLEAPLRLLRSMAHVAQVFEDDIRSSRSEGGGWLINVTTFDGRFGLGRGGALPVAQAGSLGFFKSLGREWRGVRVKNIDLDPQADPRTLLIGLLQEMEAADSSVEVGFDGEGRWRLALVEETLTAHGGVPDGGPLLDEHSVVLATGGADGITAEVVKRLAHETRTRLVLVGRTPLCDPGDEPEELRGLSDEGSLRAALIARLRAAGPVLPAAVEHELRRVQKARRVRATIESCRAAGSAVEYHALDVRNGEAFAALVDSVYARCGRIDGVLHGAGVLEDGWLREKSAESMARVFETKVNGAIVLARRLRPVALRFLVFFSSLSGRFGNAGQTDYSAANEYLNKLAVHLDGEWPARVVAVNWGPWNTGMISDSLRAAYAARGIGLIDVASGVRALLDELRHPEAHAPEVALTCTPQRIAELAESPV